MLLPFAVGISNVFGLCLRWHAFMFRELKYFQLTATYHQSAVIFYTSRTRNVCNAYSLINVRDKSDFDYPTQYTFAGINDRILIIDYSAVYTPYF